MNGEGKLSSLATQRTDIIFAVGMVGIIGIMIVPLPPFLLDVLLSFNLSCAFIVFLLTVYIDKPLDFSVFPSLLLLSTLFRLSLNICSTRLILLQGYAGKVIQSFGYFVVGGNYIVGMIVFFILVIINFIVITKGATRISEVAARFTLDAMPGRQMSIDADLNAGMITADEARERRKEIERQADFYGAMDGASKFVRGDAIVAIIILFINIIGGLSIGILQKHMSVAEALQTYALLTVGDGMVSQVPALIVSTAAGIILTRASSSSHLAQDFIRQILSRPWSIAVVSSLLFICALIPGLPKLPLFGLAVLGFALFYIINRNAKTEAIKEVEEEKGIKKEENVEDLLRIDILELEIGYGLIPLADESQGGDLLERITLVRRQIALEIGMIVPPVRVRDSVQLKPNEYQIKIKGAEVARGEIMVRHYLAIDTGVATGHLEGIKTKEPAFDLPAIWIKENEKEKAEMAGYTVVGASSVLITHLTEIVKSFAHELLGRQEVQSLVGNLKKDYPAVIEELIPEGMKMGEVQKVLQNLLWERVSIKDLLTILETLADWAPQTKNIDILTEYVRKSLARSISRQYQNEEEKMYVITLDPKLEARISQGIEHKERTSYVNLPPQLIQKIIASFTPLIKKAGSLNHQPIVLTSPAIRAYFKRITEKFIPSLVVLSYNEIVPEVKIRSIGIVNVPEDKKDIR